MKFLGTISAVLTALYLADLTTIPLLVCLLPLGCEIALNTYYRMKAQAAQARLLAEISKLGQELEKEMEEEAKKNDKDNS